MEPLLVRIFDVDSYMCAPIQNVDVTFSQFRGSAIQQVPVIRIFGSTDTGRKICVHVHGVFPYFYIPYDGSEAANGLMYKIASNVDKAINVSLGHGSSNTQHVYKIALVSGIPFYGYHSKNHQFFKVYLYNPIFIKRVNNLLFNPSVLGKIFQPHETHINFTLQFMMDYNLHGMSNIILSEVKFREDSIIINENVGMEDVIAKVSSCELECDTSSECILNRKEIESGKLAANPGIAALWEDEKQRRRNKNEDSQLPHYLSLSKTNVPETESHELFKRALRERLAIISQDKQNEDFNQSIYPAECPKNKRLTNCSFVDFHSPQNSQSDVSYDSFNDTLTDTLNITVDEDVQDLIDVLKDLEKNVSVEDDSILSQVPKDEAEDLEEDADMSLSLEANNLDETLKFDESLDTTIKIPQLDGHCQDFNTPYSANAMTILEKQKANWNLKDNVRKKPVVMVQNIQDVVPRNELKKICEPESNENSNDSDISLSEEAALLYKYSHPIISYLEANNYFSAPSIGERVAKKNQAKRNKLRLKLQLECCRDVSVHLERLHLPLPLVNKKGRDMPSLQTEKFSDIDDDDLKLKPLRIIVKRLPNGALDRIKKTIKRRVRVVTTASKSRNVDRRYCQAQQLVKRSANCLNMLRTGMKPRFRIIPAYKPYIFKVKNPVIEQTYSPDTNTIESSTRSIQEIFKAQKENEARFFNSIHSIMDNFSINVDKLLKRHDSLLFLDGANDSASDDEEKNKGKPNKIPASNYTPLPIFTGDGIPTTSTKQINSEMRRKNVDSIKKELKHENCDTIENHKKHFQDETILEEKLTCAIKPTNHQNNIVEIENRTISTVVTPVQTSKSIEPEKDSENSNFEENISTSELYDIINGYHPQEGTSKSFHYENLKTPEPNDDENSSKSSLFGENSNSLNVNEIESAVDDELPCSGSTSDMFCSQKENFEYHSPAEEKCSSENIVFYKPLYKAPTRNDVEKSMADYQIPKIRSEEPFYGNAEDASSGLEVGYNFLKIKTKTSVDVPEFESSFEGIDSFRRKHFPIDSKTDHIRYSHCKGGMCILTPVQKPPTRDAVMQWLREKSGQVIEKVEPKKVKKIYIISSQDGISDDSLDMSLSLTPLTPKSDTSRLESDLSQESRDSGESTPKSSRSRTSSPVLTSRRRKKLDKSLRKSLLTQSSSENSGVISGVTLDNTYGFKHSLENFQNARPSIMHEHLTIFSMELHINTRGDFKPNPQYDEISAIFYSIFNDVEENSSKPTKSEGVFVVNQTNDEFLKNLGVKCDVKYVPNELELFKEFTKFITDWDPDILVGYEIQMLSWGYLIERSHNLGTNIIPELSRVKDKHLKFNEKETGDLRVTGRVVLDFWRLLRHEVALQSYTLQSTVFEVLQKRIPKYSFRDLTNWWDHPTYLYKHRVVNYYLTCVRCVLKIIESLDLIGRTSELARLFGIQFFEVLSRGSQFRVESMMLRLAKPLNYVAVSPSVQQRAKMKAPEYIALVLEPESKLYTDPVIVLDFQSLYPSIIIAYNYCFSTCVGRIGLLGKNEPFEFGATNYRISKERVKYLLKRNQLHFSPCGVAFVKKSVRDGIMPRMLREILDTRLMVKKSMKENKEDTVLQKVLHNRQLGLKLIANVTYGYTAANFSGRMASVEVADSIVSKARETLQRAIALVDGNKDWGVRVVYGDTDSLFVHCPGKSREEAFAIGEEIVETVGKENPDPMKLKLEKVYQPCILQTKKRYVGYMYESPDQKDPTYDAKGIETVRRDGCPAVSKMLEKTLRLLFETKDVSRVKNYCLKQFNKIISGRISIQDLTFAKEYRGFTGYKPGACVPSLELAKKWVGFDKRAEPRRGERVPYVIINGPPGLPLIRLVRSPYELINDPALRPNALYYITRVIIPPLNRCFNLIGADINQWFQQMPRKQLQSLPTTSSSPTKKSTISQYFVSTLCTVCGVQTQNGLCESCRKRPQETVVVLNEKVRQWEASFYNCKLLCSSCTQILDEPKCISLDCPVFYRFHRTNRDLQQSDHIRLLLSQHFDIF